MTPAVSEEKRYTGLMMQKARRAVATSLILSLLVSLAPRDAYAIVVKTAPVGASPVVAKVGLPGFTAGAVAPLSLSVAAPSLSGLSGVTGAPVVLAPAIALAAPNDAPQTPGAPKAAPDALPDALPAASETAPSAEAPVAAAPAERRTLLGGLKSLLARGLPRNGVFPGLDQDDSRGLFDGSAPKSGETLVPAASVKNGVGQWALNRFNKHVEKRSQDQDPFGGPKPIGPMTGTQKAGYGLKWGLNMVGIVALYDLALRPVLAAVAWPSLLGDQMLESFGRVALLTKLGPTDIAAALSLSPGSFLGLPLLAVAAAGFAAKPLIKSLTARGFFSRRERLAKALVYGGVAAFALMSFSSSPGAFLGMSLPLMVGMEEVSYRVLSFLPAFVALALTRPFTHWLAAQMDKIPNHAGVRGMVQGVLRLIGGTVAWYAYPVAAVMAAYSFAYAHFGAWGVDPYVFFVQFTLGLILTRIAYKSESLWPSIAAHLTFNLAMFGAPLLLAFGMPGLATAYGLLASIGGMVFLLYNYLAHRKDAAAAKKGLFTGGAASLSIAALAAGLVFGAAQHAGQSPTLAGWKTARPAATILAHDVAPATPLTTAAPTTTEPAPTVKESRADVVARIAPSVFRVRTGNSLGTGFIISPQGLAVSNAHVVGATPVGGIVMVDIPGAPPLKAKVIAVNHDKDIALLQLPRRPGGAWKALTISKTAPRVGDETLAIGYPLGLEKTVTRGIVSGLGRHLNMYVAHIQTDASINSGNSGGPLFNEAGEVIGINTAIKTPTGGSVGLGFSITSQDLLRTVAQFAALRNIDSGRIGVAINLSDPLKPEAGLVVEYVYGNSGAQKAGLLRGDLIIGIGGAPLLEGGEDAAKSLAAALARTVPGQKLPITVLRGEHKVDLEVVVDAKPSYPDR